MEGVALSSIAITGLVQLKHACQARILARDFCGSAPDICETQGEEKKVCEWSEPKLFQKALAF